MKQSINPSMMTLLTNDRMTGTRDFTGEFILSPATLAGEDLAQKPLSRLSREQLAAFLEAESGNARSAHFNVPPAEPAPPTPEKGVAVGVLKQAAYDLRRFRTAAKGADRDRRRGFGWRNSVRTTSGQRSSNLQTFMNEYGQEKSCAEIQL